MYVAEVELQKGQTVSEKTVTINTFWLRVSHSPLEPSITVSPKIIFVVCPALPLVRERCERSESSQ